MDSICFPWRFVGDVIRAGALVLDGPNLIRETTRKAWVLCGKLRGFFEAVGNEKPVAADDFLGFREGTIRDSRSGYQLPSDREPLAGFHPSFLNQPVDPSIEGVNGPLDLLRRLGGVPLTS